MSNLGFGWVRLNPSRRARRMAVGASLLTLLVGFSLIAAALQRPLGFRWVAMGIALAIALAVWLGQRHPQANEVRLNHDGSVNGRRHSTDDPHPLTVVFQAPWLVVLRAGRSLVPVWPDSLGDASFRRLAVAARWCIQKEPV